MAKQTGRPNKLTTHLYDRTTTTFFGTCPLLPWRRQPLWICSPTWPATLLGPLSPHDRGLRSAPGEMPKCIYKAAFPSVQNLQNVYTSGGFPSVHEGTFVYTKRR